MGKLFTVRKFEGDDQGSWAVFRAVEVRGKGPIIFAHQATPIVCGCVRDEALSFCKQFEKEATSKKQSQQDYPKTLKGDQ